MAVGPKGHNNSRGPSEQGTNRPKVCQRDFKISKIVMIWALFDLDVAVATSVDDAASRHLDGLNEAGLVLGHLHNNTATALALHLTNLEEKLRLHG